MLPQKENVQQGIGHQRSQNVLHKQKGQGISPAPSLGCFVCTANYKLFDHRTAKLLPGL